MRSAGSRRRSGEEQAPNSLGETRAGSSTMGVWIWAAFQLLSAHDALRTDRADLMRWPWVVDRRVLDLGRGDQLVGLVRGGEAGTRHNFSHSSLQKHR